MTALPRFAVVGHPNKGKSSIVATLAQNDGIAIALEPGTTRDSQRYPLSVDGRPLYELIDTPGFQRPRKVLAWLQAHSASASDRPDTVRAFVTQHRDDPRFHDECELLTPILEGAGILYVVDGAVPYSPEQEAEMEILRWTGRPSLALINRIGEGDHLDDWRAALGQYFQIVRDFDAVHAPFETHLSLLRGFGQLAPEWEAPLEEAVGYLRGQRGHRQHRAMALIAEALTDMLLHVESARLADDANRNALEHDLARRWRDRQRQREQHLRRDVEALYQHRHLHRREQALDWQGGDLFSEQTRRAWGVSRAYLATAGFGAGALGGAGVDALAAGHSLGTGALIGGVLGAAGSLYYGEKYAGKLAALKLLAPLTGGGRRAEFGPVRDPQFGYVVLGRALEHWFQVSHRNHAGRDPLTLDQGDRHWLEQLPRGDRQRLQKALQNPPRHPGDGKRRQALELAVENAGAAFLQWRSGNDEAQ
ncbi:hypothetical protein Y5W_00158 [Alcanivorax sp. 521-1]|uniref:G domain-containing protein n=1 Tax=Alloalcanivorax profundimaris TaxID=2735259 RepID=A0ABS0ALR3_9GAMM|nr:GTPase/DUF3482 domain-containing protein [Alloalcanivorax profundimaris]MBF5054864.1 hypothetical protein [Alloalcanivorax profundimaris]